MRAIKRYDNGGKGRPNGGESDPRARGSIYEGREGNQRQYEAARRARQMLGPYKSQETLVKERGRAGVAKDLKDQGILYDRKDPFQYQKLITEIYEAKKGAPGMSEEEYNAMVVDKAYDLMDQEHRLKYESTGGPGASATEDLLENLTDYKNDMRPIKRDYKDGGSVQGGPMPNEMKGGFGSVKIAGQYATTPIQQDEDGRQFVYMEFGNGDEVQVFGDWETYGNPTQDGLIEDLDYRILPHEDGYYTLDAGEMESEMQRDDSRKVAREAQGGPGASRIEDLMEKLSDYKGPRMPRR